MSADGVDNHRAGGQSWRIGRLGCELQGQVDWRR